MGMGWHRAAVAGWAGRLERWWERILILTYLFMQHQHRDPGHNTQTVQAATVAGETTCGVCSCASAAAAHLMLS